MAGIHCSSGTTGLPKGTALMAIPANPAPSHRTNHFFSHNSAGASLSHAAWLGSQTNFKLVQSHDVVCCFSELFWVAGMNALLWGTLFGATRIITADAFTPELHLRLIEKHRITFAMNGVPKLLEMLRCEAIAKYDLSSLPTTARWAANHRRAHYGRSMRIFRMAARMRSSA